MVRIHQFHRETKTTSLSDGAMQVSDRARGLMRASKFSGGTQRCVGLNGPSTCGLRNNYRQRHPEQTEDNPNIHHEPRRPGGGIPRHPDTAVAGRTRVEVRGNWKSEKMMQMDIASSRRIVQGASARVKVSGDEKIR